jgi:alanyl-tRNA synthetase
MTSNEIRQSFLDFFRTKEHSIVQSAPVIPHGDPTLLFTNAGMNQFKDVFLGMGKRDYTRAADTQKCIRVSGKHNDLEEVGVDTYHHTFFEMLGNWSFGDYYKNEAIQWAWELLTNVWKLDINRLHATVFRTDDEAFEIWKKYLPDSRIHRFDEKDNFWEMGETGPCGPCSEIHYDRTHDLSGGPLVNAGVPEVIEIWNLVFIQYNRKANGELEPLASTHVDTGMGFERICSVIQKKNSNYETDVFMPLINKIQDLSDIAYTSELENKKSIAMRVIADHIRTLSFAIADGAIPGNEGRGYVLRRILRRGARFARNLGFKEPMMYKLIPVLIDNFASTFPELKINENTITRIIKSEEESFLQTLDRGLDIFEDIIKKLENESLTQINGEDAFQLYDTFGFPLDLTQLIARERGLFVDVAGFDKYMKEQKERSRAARKSHNQEVELPVIDAKTVFTGYGELSTEAIVLYVNDNQIVLDKTPYYVESGGQIYDTGKIVLAGETYNVIDVKRSGDAVIHFCDRELEPLVGQKALLEVNAERRRSITRNHSATHLMHEALRQVLGNHVQQAGSLVAPDYLRFDFNHFEKPTSEQLQNIEKIVNDKILENFIVNTQVLSIEEAKKNSKVKMFFGDKYGDVVRLVTMDPKYSMELCGGTHVHNTSEIGLFKIISESSIAAGVRRIEAVTGKGIENYIDNLQIKLDEKNRVNEDLSSKIKYLERELNTIKINLLTDSLYKLIEEADNVNGNKLLVKNIAVESMDDLRDIADNLRNKAGKQAIILLISASSDKIQLACAVTDDIKAKFPAGKLVGEAAKILGGGGGGKPHLATAGGKDISKLSELIRDFKNIIINFS